jgi:hypothetical protein
MSTIRSSHTSLSQCVPNVMKKRMNKSACEINSLFFSYLLGETEFNLMHVSNHPHAMPCKISYINMKFFVF